MRPQCQGGFWRRSSSIVETKTLFSIGRTPSFVAEPGTELAFTFDLHFEWQTLLGSGSFASVWAVRHKTRPAERYAIKCYKGTFKSKAERAERLREAELANQLPSHPNVLGYYRAWQEAQMMYVQMELCEGGDMQRFSRWSKDRSNYLGTEQATDCLLQMVDGLKALHDNGIWHRDIKPANVLFLDGQIKICDYGVAKVFESFGISLEEGREIT